MKSLNAHFSVPTFGLFDLILQLLTSLCVSDSRSITVRVMLNNQIRDVTRLLSPPGDSFWIEQREQSLI